MSTATLNGQRVLSARVQVPSFGVWWADVETDSAEALTGAVTLQIADQAFVGTIVSGGVWQGRGRYHVCAGAGAWGTEIAAKDYRNDAGLKISKVILDAAAACGETVDAATLGAERTGPGFTRTAGAAATVLNLLAPEAWHVGLDGKTRLGLRSATTYGDKATRVSVDLAAGRVELAADSIAALVPGVVVDGIQAIDVEHSITAKALRTTIYGASAGSGRGVLWRQLVEQLAPSLKYRGIYEYRIVSQVGDRLNLQSVRASSGMPNVRAVPVCAGLPGMTFTPRLGACVYVAFVGADPSRPVVVGFDDTLPLVLNFDASTFVRVQGAAGLPIARTGDTVVVMGVTGAVGPGSLKATCG